MSLIRCDQIELRIHNRYHTFIKCEKMNDPIFEKLVFYIVNNDPQGFSDLLNKYPLEINTKGRKGCCYEDFILITGA